MLVRALAILSLSALAAVADAQQPVVGTGAAVPRVSVPAPHVSPLVPSLAPHMTGPRAIAPMLSRPGLAPPGAIKPQIYAPQITTPRQHQLMTPNASQVLPHSQTTALNKPLTLRNPVFANSVPRNPEGRSLARSIFRGNFANSDLGKHRDRHHHHRPVIVLGFVGQLFWPYAFNDLIDFAFWPYAYDTFWPRAYDDVFTGIYGGYAPQYYPPDYSMRTGDKSEICLGQAQRFINFPIEQIAQQVVPSEQQKALLDDLNTATAKAVSILQDACPSELPSTPPGRIAAMRTRVETMLQVVEIVRPALEKFYQSLTDEQKERFNAIDQDIEAPDGRRLNADGLCSGVLDRTAKLPVEQVKGRLQLSSDQELRFKELTEASAKAGDILNASCHAVEALTPRARLVAISDRLKGILQAVETVQEPLDRFYQSLDDEQKARFNRLGTDQPHALEDLDLGPAGSSRKVHSPPSICRC